MAFTIDGRGRSDIAMPEYMPIVGGASWTLAGEPYLAQTAAMLEDPTRMLPHYPMVLHRGGWPDGS